MIRKLYKLGEALEKRFTNNQDPFLILARLMEESGELADQVHVWESVGRKRESGRQPDEMALAKEIQQVLTAVLDLARYYGVEEKVELQVNLSYERAVSEGLIEPLNGEETRNDHPGSQTRRPA